MKSTRLSPDNYIKTKARTLPIAECWTHEDYETDDILNVIIARQHTNGNYTLGLYLIDLMCLGIKSTFYLFNIPNDEFREMLDQYNRATNMIEVPYEVVHNLVLFGLDSAREFGIEPHKDYKITQFILEEDTDDIPLIEFHYGDDDGNPVFFAFDQKQFNQYAPMLKRELGADFKYVIGNPEENLKDWDDEDDEDDEDFFDDNDDLDEEDFDKVDEFVYDDDAFKTEADREMYELFERVEAERKKELMKFETFFLANPICVEAEKKFQNYKPEPLEIIETDFEYKHQKYPNKLTLNHSELTYLQTQASPQLIMGKVKNFLMLPRTTLIADLIQIIRYEIGEYYNRFENEDELNENLSIVYCFALLGELEAEESFDVVLEFLRQDDFTIESLVGDHLFETLPFSFYKIAKNQLSKFIPFFEDQLLDPINKTIISEIAEGVYLLHPEKRDEIVNLFEQLVDVSISIATDSSRFETFTADCLIYDMVRCHDERFIPLIIKLIEANVCEEIKPKDFKENILQLYSNISDSEFRTFDNLAEQLSYEFR